MSADTDGQRPKSVPPYKPPSYRHSHRRQTTTGVEPVTQVLYMSNLTAADLPLLGMKGAPKKCTGGYSEVDRFLYYYARLCQKYNLSRNKDKIKNISQYCSRGVREVLEGLPAFSGDKWTAFVEDVRKYFEADRETKRYRINDVEVYVKKTKHRYMKTLED